MLPSPEDIANFITFAPNADEGKAFMFLEVRNPDAFVILSIRLADVCREGCGYHR
jgi:hypothetical protein